MNCRNLSITSLLPPRNFNDLTQCYTRQKIRSRTLMNYRTKRHKERTEGNLLRYLNVLPSVVFCRVHQFSWFWRVIWRVKRKPTGPLCRLCSPIARCKASHWRDAPPRSFRAYSASRARPARPLPQALQAPSEALPFRQFRFPRHCPHKITWPNGIFGNAAPHHYLTR